MAEEEAIAVAPPGRHATCALEPGVTQPAGSTLSFDFAAKAGGYSKLVTAGPNAGQPACGIIGQRALAWEAPAVQPSGVAGGGGGGGMSQSSEAASGATGGTATSGTGAVVYNNSKGVPGWAVALAAVATLAILWPRRKRK